MKDHKIELKEIEENHVEEQNKGQSESWQDDKNSLSIKCLKKFACNSCTSVRKENESSKFLNIQNDEYKYLESSLLFDSHPFVNIYSNGLFAHLWD